jgi:2',3'-cyclic-nucleotide 2'-phosphodiesterase (5'-nucleotidase family)
MKQYGDRHGGVDLSFMNVEGHRAAMSEGEITVGSMFEIYSFENVLVYVDLRGEDLTGIFDRFAQTSPQGYSSNVELAIRDGKVESLSVDGKEIDPRKIYRIITLDYLAGGNDNMAGLKKATSVRQSGITLRDMMIDYVKQCTARGEKIDL